MEPTGIDFAPDDLTRQYRWVRALAARLVRDDAEADDVAQETWLVARDRPPPDGVPLRAWLAGILRNLVRSRRRDEARRGALLRAGARERGTEPADAAVARAEIEHRIAAAVLALDEPYRTTVLLRYREGLSSAAIARRAGVPAATVRWRLMKALALLRARLDRDHDGDRRAWLAPAALLAGRPPRSPIPALLAGAALMKSKIAAALVAACLLTALALVAVRGPSAASPSEATGAAAGPLVAAPAAGADSGPETADAAADLAAPEAGRPTITLRGRVLDGDGTPVAGVAVRSAAAADGELPERVSTADDGRFEWREPLTDREVQAVELRFRHPQFVARSVAAHSLHGQPVTLGDVVLTRGGRVSGRVVDDRGEPVAGALVQPGEIDAAFPWREFGDWATSGPSTTTDAEGRFSLGGVPAGWYRFYAVGAETYYGRSEPLGIVAGERLDAVRIEAPRVPDGEWIEVRVLDAAGVPVGGRRIDHDYRWSGGQGCFEVTADADGRARVRCSGEGSHGFSLRTRWGERVEVADVHGGESVVLRYPLPPEGTGRRLRVGARDARTKGSIFGFELTVLVDGGPRESPDVRNGVATFDEPGRPYELAIVAPAYEAGNREVRTPGAGPEEIVVDLEPLPVVSGIVTADGRPVPGAEVSWIGLPQPMETFGFPVRSLPKRGTPGVTTDDEGRFSIPVPREDRDDRFWLRATAAGWPAGEAGPLDLRRLPDGEVRIRLRRGGAVEGRVLVPAGRSPAGVVVAASRGDGFPVCTRTDEGGAYRFDGLAPGPWQIETRAESFDYRVRRGASGLDDDAAIPSNCVVRSDGTTTLDLSLREEDSFALRGRFTLGGRVLPGFRVAILRAREGSPEPIDPAVDSAGVLPDGTWELRVGSSGEYLLRIEDERSHFELTAPVRLRVASTRRDFDLGAGTVEGRLSGEPPTGREDFSKSFVRWDRSDPDGVRIRGGARADADGSFLLPYVPAGEVEISCGGRRARVTVPAGGRVSVDLR